MDGEINRWMKDGWIEDRWMDGRIKDGWVGKCIDRKIMGWFIGD